MKKEKTDHLQPCNINNFVRELLLFYIRDVMTSEIPNNQMTSDKEGYLTGFLNTMSIFAVYLDNHNQELLSNLIDKAMIYESEKLRHLTERSIDETERNV